MIRLISGKAECVRPDPCLIKIGCNAELYSDIALFWEQDDGRALISMLDGNMVIYNRDADIEELREFIAVLSPSGIFTDAETLISLGFEASEPCDMLTATCVSDTSAKSDTLSSRQLYDILNTDGLTLPDYEYFAVDICRRLNHGKAKYFGFKDICAAVTVECGNYVLLNGIASRKKGMGSIALKGVLSLNAGKTAVVCCRKEVSGFYLKNGFEFINNYAYWVRK